MTECEYCAIDPAARYGVLTRLGHRVHLCEACARRHGIAPHRPQRARPPAKRQLEVFSAGQA